MSKETDILTFLRQPHEYPPSIREIGAAVGLSSSSSVHVHLKKLEAQGLIERRPNSPRCIRIRDSYNKQSF